MKARAKFEVRSFTVPEIIGGTLKLWAASGYAHALFCKIFNGLLFAWFVRMDPENVQAKFEVRSFIRS